MLWRLKKTTRSGEWRRNRLELDDAAAYTNCDRFRAIIRAELLHDVLDVALHGFLADEEHGGYVAVAIASGDPLKNLDFSPAEELLSHVLSKLSRDFRRNVTPAIMYFSDGFQQFTSGHALEHVALCACLQR